MMNITKENRGGIPVLCVSGPLVGRNWQKFTTQLKALLQNNDQQVGLDLSQVTRMGQCEARQLINARDRLTRRKVTLSLLGLSPASVLAIGRAAAPSRSRTA